MRYFPGLKLLDQYVFWISAKYFLLVLVGLIVIYMGYISSVSLALVLAGDMPRSTIGLYLISRLIIALEVILPLSAYMSVVLGLTNLHRNNEAFVFYSAGVSPLRLNRASIVLTLIFAALALFSTVIARPWAYAQSDNVLSSKVGISISNMQASTVYQTGDGTVILARHVDRSAGTLRDVFMNRRADGVTHVIRAKTARFETVNHGNDVLKLIDGTGYDIRYTDAADQIRTFKQLDYQLPQVPDAVKESRRKAISTTQLRESNTPYDMAEVQWRLAAPMMVALMGIIAIVLAKTKPGQDAAPRVWLALLVYLVIVLASTSIRSAVENGQIDSTVGVFYLPAVIAVLLVIGGTISRRQSL